LSSVVLALDFTPNPVHAPIYAAVDGGRDRARGVRLRIRRPGGSPDSLKLVASGRVDIGVLDIHDLAIARQEGVDLVAVAALVNRPLAALIARGEIRRPRDLEGKTVGVSGLPSDPAFLRAILEHDGGDYDKVREVTIGFAAVGSLITGKVAAVPAFWNAEGVALRRRGFSSREFRVEDYGAPPYPEVVLITARKTIEERRPQIEAAVAAIGQGVRDVIADPEASVRSVAAAAKTDDLALMRAQLSAVQPLFSPDLALDRPVLERWADFDAQIGIVDRRTDVEDSFDFTIAG
jgi:NitT/TauT family transport system substrate-binding protein/putative hydroxymethylpyrimidine transport system substrate-binding protein